MMKAFLLLACFTFALANTDEGSQEVVETIHETETFVTETGKPETYTLKPEVYTLKPEVVTEKPPKSATTKNEAGKCGAPLSALAEKYKASLLAEHNEYRAKENAGLPPLTWDNKLAARSQQLGNTCTDEHGLLKTCKGVQLGQNLYTSSESNVTAAVWYWWDEKQYYDHNTLTCQSGKQCGHYTQVVWRTTTKVGCGIASCGSKLFGTPESYIVVCDYLPAGNWDGQKPY